jgi:drug/metabolite transporter (DMT)-like permease
MLYFHLATMKRSGISDGGAAVEMFTMSILVTVILSYAFLGETISLRQAAGIVLGIAAVFLLAT